MKKTRLLFSLILIGLISASASAQNFIEIIKATSSDGTSNEDFGYAVAISGNRAVVSATRNDDIALNNGCAYIFDLVGGVWTETQKLIASDAGAYDGFGSAVAISGDKVIIGAHANNANGTGSNSGSAYIFELSGGVWTETAKLIGSSVDAGDYFGYKVGISGDWAIVGAYSDDTGSANAGAAYLFNKSGGVWTETQLIQPSGVLADDNFGYSVSISNDKAVIGAPGDDDGGSKAGAAYIYDLVGGVWTETQKIIASDGQSNDGFGKAIAIDVDRIVVGAEGVDEAATSAGAAYVFDETSGTWSETQKLLASNAGGFDYFGNTVSVSGDKVVVGAYGNGTMGSYAGMAYVFELSSGTWSETQTFFNPNGENYDYYGCSVSISGETVIIGASGDNTASNGAGAIFIWKNCIPTTGIDVINACAPIVWIDGNTYSSDNNTATFNIAGGAGGCDSLVTLNLTMNTPATGTDVQTACDSFEWIDGVTYTASNNTATFNIVGGAANGCDSIVTLDLTMNTIELGVTVVEPTLTADATMATYNWLDCDNNYAVITGQTSQSFTPSANGDYAVEVTQNGCIDTTMCYTIGSVGVKDDGVSFGGVSIFPNPVSHESLVSVELGELSSVSIKVMSLSGEVIYQVANINSLVHQFEMNEAAGVYFIEVSSKGDSKQFKLIKL